MDYDTFTPLVVEPSPQQLPQQLSQPQYRQSPQQQPNFSQTTYNPNIPIQQDEYDYNDEYNFDIKKYITMFLLIFIIYFIFSLDGVKNQIGLLITCINVKEDGTISKWGYFSYGLLLSVIIVGLNILIDKFIVVKF